MVKWYLIREIKKQERPVLAVDIGGTKMAMAIISEQGEVIARQSQPTLAHEGQQAVIKRLLSGIDQLLKETNLLPPKLNAISLATAGIIDIRKNLVTVSPNLPGWHDVPLRRIIAEKYRTPTYLLNDADAAALGEHHRGILGKENDAGSRGVGFACALITPGKAASRGAGHEIRCRKTTRVSVLGRGNQSA